MIYMHKIKVLVPRTITYKFEHIKRTIHLYSLQPFTTLKGFYHVKQNKATHFSRRGTSTGRDLLLLLSRLRLLQPSSLVPVNRQVNQPQGVFPCM